MLGDRLQGQVTTVRRAANLISPRAGHMVVLPWILNRFAPIDLPLYRLEMRA